MLPGRGSLFLDNTNQNNLNIQIYHDNQIIKEYNEGQGRYIFLTRIR